MNTRILFLTACCLFFAVEALASGYGVFTQGASALGQANAVVAHPTGPSSIYFNPALMNDIPGRQVEVGTTMISVEREVKLDSTGATESADKTYNFPSTFYYTHNTTEKLAAGIGIFFPFGLSSEWDKDYEGRYLGTSAEMFSMNINPAVSWRVNDKLSLAAGLDFIYIDTELRSMVNQVSAGVLRPPFLGDSYYDPTQPDAEQKFTGEGWGAGFNLGMLFKATDRISIGAAYRSEVDIDTDDGDVKFSNVDPRLTYMLIEGEGETSITLPAQFTAGIATRVTDDLIVEIGVRWEDWASTDELKVDLQNPVLGQYNQTIPRDWKSTWTYNIGGQYRLNDTVKINAGYLYGDNPVPNSTFEPLIPDSNTHLFTIGTELTLDQWTVSGAFGYEYHESRDKDNALSDPLGAPVSSANGEYNTDIYLLALSVGYKF